MSDAFNRTALQLHERLTGRRILARLDELNRSQWLSRDELFDIQQKRLFSLMDYVNKFVPYYQRMFKEIGFQPEDLRKDPDNFKKIPILTKDIIRKNFDDMLTAEPERRRLLQPLSTSGSTGTPLKFMQDSEFRDTVTADVQRHMGWGGWNLGDTQAVIWGSNPNVGWKKKIRSGLIDLVWNRFQMNAFAITEGALDKFTREVIQRKPKILFGYASGILRLAKYLQDHPDREITFQSIFTSAEQLVPPVREVIEQTFRCKVFDRYGTFELGGLACECEAHDGLHISMENNLIEISCNEENAQDGKGGDLIITNLINRGMPFIRYSIGDVGAFDMNSTCPCGRAAPKLMAIHGRKKDLFHTRDGRTIITGFSGYSFNCLADPRIRQFQIIQKTLDQILIRLATDGDIPTVALENISTTFRDVFGNSVRVDIEILDEILPLPSGKYQYAISEINSHQ